MRDASISADGGALIADLWRYDASFPVPLFDMRGRQREEDLADCGDVAGFLRCDGRCSDRCALGTTCLDYLGVCRARHPRGTNDSCSFYRTDVPPLPPKQPFTGLPCAMRESAAGVAGDPYQGLGMPPEYCVAARSVGLPPQRCLYADGTEVVTGPPADECPGNVGLMRVCGGSCGESLCTATIGPEDIHQAPCVGVSDQRGFGLCAFDTHYCSERTVRERIAECESALMAWWSGREPCVCLVSSQQPEGVDAPIGFVVPQDACVTYRGFFPETVECRDESWDVVP